MNKEKVKELEKSISVLQKELDKIYLENKNEEIKNVEKEYVGKCFKRDDTYYKVISALTPEMPYQLWCFAFNPSPRLKPQHKMSLHSYRNDFYDYQILFNGVSRITKKGNNLMVKFDPEEEITEEEFFAAYDTYCENLKEEMKKVFLYEEDR